MRIQVIEGKGMSSDPVEIDSVEECVLNAVFALNQFGDPKTRLGIARFVRIMIGEMPFQLVGPPLSEDDMKPEVAAAIASLTQKLCLYYVVLEDSYELTDKGMTALEKVRERWAALLTPEVMRDFVAGMYSNSKTTSLTESVSKKEYAVGFVLDNLPLGKKLDHYQLEMLKSDKPLTSYAKKRRK